MRISVFFSHPRPVTNGQEELVDHVREYLDDRGLDAKTLGVSDYDDDVPLASVRRLMLESNGVLGFALRRYEITEGSELNPTSFKPAPLSHRWMTSPWVHIEAAMGSQLSLPVLVFREKGVLDDGVLKHGVMNSYMPELDVDSDIDAIFESEAWKQRMSAWEGRVRSYHKRKGTPRLDI